MWLSLVLPLLLAAATALDNGVGLTPPMGWLSWLYSGCSIDCVKEPKRCLSEQLVKRIADQLVLEGYRDVGYRYIIIDDCWPERERGPDGKIIPDKTRFKSGMKALGDYLHSKGLKFGIYGDIGTKTCAGYPGLAGHEVLDAQTFVEWGVDYIKLDGCYANPNYFNITYPMFGKILNQTGRPIHYSCSWPAYQEGMEVDYKVISETCNTWRNYNDVEPTWKSVLNIMDWYGDNRDRLAPYGGPGHFHDPDMLIAGHPGVSYDQAVSQLYVWIILSAPLLLSADVDNLKYVKSDLQYKHGIFDILQDPGGLMGYRFQHSDDADMWLRTLTTKDDTIIVRVQRNTSLHDTSQPIKRFKISRKKLRLRSGKYEVRQRTSSSAETKTIVYIKDELMLEIKPAGVNIFRVTRLKDETFEKNTL